jgi:hypothetical protein
MASRAALRWWPWGIGKPSRSRVTRKWISEEAPEVFPLMFAVGTGLTMGVGTIAYQLLYNPSIMCAVLVARAALHLRACASERGLWFFGVCLRVCACVRVRREVVAARARGREGVRVCVAMRAQQRRAHVLAHSGGADSSSAMWASVAAARFFPFLLF